MPGPLAMSRNIEPLAGPQRTRSLPFSYEFYCAYVRPDVQRQGIGTLAAIANLFRTPQSPMSVNCPQFSHAQKLRTAGSWLPLVRRPSCPGSARRRQPPPDRRRDAEELAPRREAHPASRPEGRAA